MISTICTKNAIPGYSLYTQDRTKHNYTIYTETKNRTKNRINSIPAINCLLFHNCFKNSIL